MAFHVLESSDGRVTLKVTAELKKTELDQIQALALEAIRKWGKNRALVILEDFRGWERGANWGDITFLDRHGAAIEKMAVVGDEKWRDLALAFMGKGLRPTVIEYFSPSARNRAQAWLGEA